MVILWWETGYTYRAGPRLIKQFQQDLHIETTALETSLDAISMYRDSLQSLRLFLYSAWPVQKTIQHKGSGYPEHRSLNIQKTEATTYENLLIDFTKLP